MRRRFFLVAALSAAGIFGLGLKYNAPGWFLGPTLALAVIAGVAVGISRPAESHGLLLDSRPPEFRGGESGDDPESS